METKTNELLQEAKRIIGEDADILVIFSEQEKYASAVKGNTDNIAKALFSCMHQPGNPIGAAIYRIVKLNVMNIISNESKYSDDLIRSINSILPENE